MPLPNSTTAREWQATDAMPALTNQKQEDFAQAIARRTSATEAYRAGHPNASRKTCAEAGSRLAKHVNVVARISELTTLAEKAVANQQAEAEKAASKKLVGTLLTMTDRRRIMAQIANDDTEESDSRMRAVMNDAKLAGELIEKTDLTTDGEALPAAMPSIVMNVPTSFVSRRQGSAQN